jgi:hypothetical protein
MQILKSTFGVLHVLILALIALNLSCFTLPDLWWTASGGIPADVRTAPHNSLCKPLSPPYQFPVNIYKAFNGQVFF